MMTEKLVSCPFCGELPESFNKTSACCRNPKCPIRDWLIENATWNRRAPQAAPLEGEVPVHGSVEDVLAVIDIMLPGQGLGIGRCKTLAAAYRALLAKQGGMREVPFLGDEEDSVVRISATPPAVVLTEEEKAVAVWASMMPLVQMINEQPNTMFEAELVELHKRVLALDRRLMSGEGK